MSAASVSASLCNDMLSLDRLEEADVLDTLVARFKQKHIGESGTKVRLAFFSLYSYSCKTFVFN